MRSFAEAQKWVLTMAAQLFRERTAQLLRPHPCPGKGEATKGLPELKPRCSPRGPTVARWRSRPPLDESVAELQHRNVHQRRFLKGRRQRSLRLLGRRPSKNATEVSTSLQLLRLQRHRSPKWKGYSGVCGNSLGGGRDDDKL